MLKKKIGFIGCGKMAQAMIGGMLKQKLVSPNDIIASARTMETRKTVNEQFHIQVTEQNQEAAMAADFLVLAVPPSEYRDVINEIKESVKSNTVIVTIAAGITIADVEAMFHQKVKVARTMPNTPSLIGAGMTGLCVNEQVSKEELQDVRALFESFGSVEVIEEGLMDAIPAISGSSPAYVYMLIEAMADGGVQQGLTRNVAYRLAAQAVLGAAQMVLESGKHPGELKDQVCSPGGATIAAVADLEKNQFRGAVLSAMGACTARVKELG